jgi:Major Facilitator Superfamily
VETRYLLGASAARAGDEMSGPAVLLLGFAVTGTPAAGSALLACLTASAAAGGVMLGALLDRSRRPGRLLAVALAGYAAGLLALQVLTGRVPLGAVLPIALAAGVFSPAVAGGWTSQLPRLVAPGTLPRASAIDALTFSAASLAGPGLAAITAAWLGARTAVLGAATLIALAVPAALSLASQTVPVAPSGRCLAHRWRHRHAGRGSGLVRQVGAGIAAIWRRPALRRATVTSGVSYVGIGMLLVCCPLLGKDRLGAAAHGALLISAMAAASLIANAALARRARPAAGWRADTRVLVSTLVIGGGMAAAAVLPGWFTALAVAAGGAGEGPQLTAVFEVRHREAPAGMRGQIFTTAASLKIAGMSLGAALAGPLAGRSVLACLLISAGVEACAAVAYLVSGPRRRGTAGRSRSATPEPDNLGS